jgi:hypothetical protein
MTLEEEKALLKQFAKAAGAGELLNIHDLKAAYEKAIGHPTSNSTLYNLLARHDWRKLMPRPFHPGPLLKEPLSLAHIKPRLLGHWGTTPGLNFIYVHLNRAIRRRDLALFTGARIETFQNWNLAASSTRRSLHGSTDRNSYPAACRCELLRSLSSRERGSKRFHAKESLHPQSCITGRSLHGSADRN